MLLRKIAKVDSPHKNPKDLAEYLELAIILKVKRVIKR